MRFELNEQDVKEYINRNIEDWVFDEHILKYHLNLTDDELQARIWKYNDSGKLVIQASTFIDDTNGDDIVQGIAQGLMSKTARILRWLSDPADDSPLTLLFPKMPQGVRGRMCTALQRDAEEVSGYLVVLLKGVYEYSFYLHNAYPIEIQR